MNNEELQNKIEESFKFAEKTLTETGSIVPMLNIDFKDMSGKQCNMQVVLMDSDSEKRRKFILILGATMGAIKRLNKIKEINSITMISEVWFTMPSEKEVKLMKGNFKPPSQSANKREGLLATSLSDSGIALFKIKEMISVEVKGKRHFSLNDVPEINDKTEQQENKYKVNLLDNFFDGIKQANEGKQSLFELGNLFKDMPLDEMLKSGIKAVVNHVGGLEAEIITNKKL